ncbi:MAG: hypothetical protein RL071_2726, partial [Pseudomonadota bacterium]
MSEVDAGESGLGQPAQAGGRRGPAVRAAGAGLWAVLVAIALHGAVLGAALLSRGAVVSAWEKGPLVDPASPYAPENALLFTVLGGVVALDLYLLVSFWTRRALRGPARALGPIAALVVGLGGSELAVSLASTWRLPTWYRPHPTLHWELRPHLRGYLYGTGDTVLNTNADGLREVAVPRAKPAGQLRVLVLGDSSNFGQGVSGAEVWSAQLEAIMQPAFATAGAELRVLNAAVPGWTTYQGRVQLERVGLSYAPDLVIAGFNNDSGPETMTDAERAVAGAPRLNAVLWRSESYLLARAGVLGVARALLPAARGATSRRAAGERPVYGALDADHRDALRPRVPVAQTLENLRAMQALGAAHGFRVVWLNMPINRTHPELVERYVNYDDRAQILAASAAGAAPPVIDVDDRWARSREAGLHILGHVFHPNARGHRRLAEQVAAELVSRGLLPGLPPGAVAPAVGGPPPAQTEDTLRLGISSLTPVHAHVLAVLQADPGLAARHGLRVDLRPYLRGGPQGDDVAAGRLDAWFSCELPAIEMARARPDAGLVASLGALGRIAALGQTGEAPVAGARVGLSPNSTPALDWARWGRGIGAEVVPTQTEDLLDGVLRGELDLMVSWDPWVSAAEAEGLQASFARPFHSVLMVGGHWALGGRSALRPQGEEGPP